MNWPIGGDSTALVAFRLLWPWRGVWRGGGVVGGDMWRTWLTRRREELVLMPLVFSSLAESIVGDASPCLRETTGCCESALPARTYKSNLRRSGKEWREGFPSVLGLLSVGYAAAHSHSSLSGYS